MNKLRTVSEMPTLYGKQKDDFDFSSGNDSNSLPPINTDRSGNERHRNQFHNGTITIDLGESPI